MTAVSDRAARRHFPLWAGVFFGLGLGGFFDGVILHQVLQWHHMLSSWYPVNTIENLQLNTLWDGHISQQHIHIRRDRPLHPVAISASTTSLLVHQTADRLDVDRLWGFQCCRGVG